MIAVWILLAVAGLGLLIKGADWFVDGSAGIAKKAGVSSLIIGLTVVAFGTSAPELAVSVTGAITGSTDISVGNVLGSNIANIFLILGVTSLIRKLPVTKDSLRIDLPVLVSVSALFIGLGLWKSAINWWDGIILLAVLALYLTFLIVKAKHQSKKKKAEELSTAPAFTESGGSASPEAETKEDSADMPPAEEEKETAETAPQKGKRERKLKTWYEGMLNKLWFCILFAFIGLAMVVGGGIALVEGAKRIAFALGASERIIALTVVAIGTSLPELVTSVVAAAKKETDIAVGNIIGSNIFNILLIAGASSLFAPLPFLIDKHLVDALVAFGACVLLYLFSLFDKHRLGIPAGIVFLCGYIGYYVYLFLF